MPIYEYRCTKRHVFDVTQRFSDDPLTTCQVCGAPAQRVLHAPAVHFKGSGFYNTDYGTRKRSREKEAAKSESSNGSKESKDAKSTSSDSSSSSSDSGSSNSGGASKSADSKKAKTAE
jgi:putative FmdB family regulatory protein